MKGTSNCLLKFFIGLFLLACYSIAFSQHLETALQSKLKGKLEVRAAFGKSNEILQYILLVGKDSYYLDFTDGPPDRFETDATVTVNHAMVVSEGANFRHLVLSNKDVEVINPKYALPLSLGPQKTLTFLVNFIDQPTNRPWSSDQIYDLVYHWVNSQYLESSYQQTTVVGQTAGWYVINVSSTDTCDNITSHVSTLGDQAAASDGIDVASYSRKVYIFPFTYVCPWQGLGTVGGASTRAWINGYATLRNIAHEMGHNLGLYHSKLLVCPGSPNTGSCSRVEYGDGTDIMGAAYTSHFNAFQKDRLGWLNYKSSPPITTVTTSGTYTIDPYETTNQNPKALKILKRDGGSDYYYLEYRQGIGYDAELASCGSACDYTRGVVFHQGNAISANTSDLLDMSPVASDRLVALLPGQSWSDPDAPNGGVTFEIVSADSTGASVKITYSNTPPPPVPDTKLDNGVPVTDLTDTTGHEKYYYIDVPEGKSLLTVKIMAQTGSTGDADLYVQYGQRPTTNLWQCRPYISGSNETCKFQNPVAGKYFIMVKAFSSYKGVTLIATH